MLSTLRAGGLPGTCGCKICRLPHRFLSQRPKRQRKVSQVLAEAGTFRLIAVDVLFCSSLSMWISGVFIVEDSAIITPVIVNDSVGSDSSLNGENYLFLSNWCFSGNHRVSCLNEPSKDTDCIIILAHKVVVSIFRVVKFPKFLRERRGVCLVVLLCPELLSCCWTNDLLFSSECGQDDLKFLYATLRFAFLT